MPRPVSRPRFGAVPFHASRRSVLTLILLLWASFAWAQPDGWDTRLTKAKSLLDQKRYQEARAFLKASLEQPDEPNVTSVFRGTVMNYLCLATHGVGAYAEAEQTCRDSLAFWERTQGPGSAQVAAGMNNLGVVYAAMGRMAEAEALQWRALEAREKIFGPSHPEIAITLGNLAEMYRQRGDLAKAVEFSRRALAIWDKQPNPSAEQAAVLNNMAVMAAMQGDNDNASMLYARALELREKLHGADHPLVASTLVNMAMLRVRQHRHAEAEAMLLRAVDILKRTSPDSADLVRALRQLGDLRLAQKRDADAARYFETAIALFEAGGAEREAVYNEMSQVCDKLAGIYAASGRTSEAKPLFHQGIRLSRKAPKPDPVEIAAAMNNLALIYTDERIYVTAEKLYREAIQTLEQAGNPNANRLAATLHNLSALYAIEGRYKDAKPLLERAVSLWEQAPGHSPELALALSHYAKLLRKMHQPSEAQQAEARSTAVAGANSLVGSPE